MNPGPPQVDIPDAINIISLLQSSFLAEGSNPLNVIANPGALSGVKQSPL